MEEPKKDDVAFVIHALEGARFEGHSIPVSVLPELSAYRDILAQIARALFFQDNPERKRVPKGFEDGFELVLRRIDEGSAVAPLERRVKAAPAPAPTGQLSLPATGIAQVPQADHFERARDLLTEMIDAMHRGAAPPAGFPLDVVRSFNKLGRSLREDEAIVMSTPGRKLVATYDRSVRKKLVLLRETTYEDVVELIGPVVQYDSQRQTFGVLVEGQTVQGSLEGLDEEALRTVRTAAVHVEDLRVRVTGTGAFDASDQVVRIVAIEDLTFAEDEDLRARLDIEKRLAALADLEAGWLDGEGAALNQSGLGWVSEVLTQAERDGLPRPYLYPTPEGSVQAEWSFPGAELSVLFDFESKAVSCVGVHTKSGAHRDEDITLVDALGIGRLVAFVQSFTP